MPEERLQISGHQREGGVRRRVEGRAREGRRTEERTLKERKERNMKPKRKKMKRNKKGGERGREREERNTERERVDTSKSVRTAFWKRHSARNPRCCLQQLLQTQSYQTTTLLRCKSSDPPSPVSAQRLLATMFVHLISGGQTGR